MERFILSNYYYERSTWEGIVKIRQTNGNRQNLLLKNILGLWLWIWCLMPLSTIFQLYHSGLFYWWRKPEYPEKNHRQTLLHNVVSSTPRLSRIRTHNFNDCIGSNKSYVLPYDHGPESTLGVIISIWLDQQLSMKDFWSA